MTKIGTLSYSTLPQRRVESRMGLINRFHRRAGDRPIELEPVRLAGGAHVSVVGESHYQEAIIKTVNLSPLDLLEPDHRVFQALLVREPGNKYDPNAIGVYSSVGQVGHLSREAALEYGCVLEEVARQGASAGICEGLIGRRDATVPYGIVLRLSIPRICLDELMR
jgi:hypothetical protein